MSFAEILLTILYAGIFSFVILQWKFFRQFGIAHKWIAAIFVIKVTAGIFYGYVFRNFYGGGDTMDFFKDSELVFSMLRKDPWLFLRLVFGSCSNSSPDLAPYHQLLMFYSTPGDYFMVRFNSIVRLFSFGYYNVHVVFYNFITLIGILYLFRACTAILPDKKNLLIISIFIFPSVLFWSSGIHKDGFTLSAYGLILFSTRELLSLHSGKAVNLKSHFLKNFLLLLFGFWLLHFRHAFWLLLFIPGWIAFLITQKFPRKVLLKYLVTYLLFFGVTMNLTYFNPDWDFLNLLSQTQNDFSKLREGSINLKLRPLDSTFMSFIIAIPNALANSFLRPSFKEIKSGQQAIYAIENMLLLLLVSACIMSPKKKLSFEEQSFAWFCLFFSLSIFITTGETIPVLGTLVRYKMPAELFLLLAGIALVRTKFSSPTKSV